MYENSSFIINLRGRYFFSLLFYLYIALSISDNQLIDKKAETVLL